mmetsp:Transcript_80674/g.237079  ORF Transcript_80674/g.237079 Transcript_80674/m.237079 type:complete len:432 (-) Transcript_80674:699-1994(-)
MHCRTSAIVAFSRPILRSQPETASSKARTHCENAAPPKLADAASPAGTAPGRASAVSGGRSAAEPGAGSGAGPCGGASRPPKASSREPLSAAPPRAANMRVRTSSMSTAASAGGPRPGPPERAPKAWSREPSSAAACSFSFILPRMSSASSCACDRRESRALVSAPESHAPASTSAALNLMSARLSSTGSSENSSDCSSRSREPSSSAASSTPFILPSSSHRPSGPALGPPRGAAPGFFRRTVLPRCSAWILAAARASRSGSTSGLSDARAPLSEPSWEAVKSTSAVRFLMSSTPPGSASVPSARDSAPVSTAASSMAAVRSLMPVRWGALGCRSPAGLAGSLARAGRPLDWTGGAGCVDRPVAAALSAASLPITSSPPTAARAKSVPSVIPAISQFMSSSSDWTSAHASATVSLTTAALCICTGALSEGS